MLNFFYRSYYLYIFVILFISGCKEPTKPPTPVDHSIPVSESLIGFNSGMMFVSPNVGRAFAESEGVALYAAMGSKVVRFPGGTVANCYHPFLRGTTTEATGYGFITDQNEASVCSSGSLHGLYQQQLDFPNQPNIIHDLIDHLKRVGGSVIYVPNVLSGTEAEYRFVMKTFKDNGIKVVGVEIGNELYFGQYRNATTQYGCKSETDYINRFARPIADFFKGNFPGVKVSLIVPGNFEDPSMDTGGTWKDRWLKAIAAEMAAFPLRYDAYSIHGYFDTNNCSSASDYKALAPCAYNEISNLKRDTVGSMRKFFTQTYSFPSRLEAWISEWNINVSATTSAIKPLVNTMFHGCVASEFVIGLIQNADWVKNSDIHSYSAAGIAAGAVFNKKNGTVNMNNGSKVTAAITYYSLKFANQAVKNGGEVSTKIKALTSDRTSHAAVPISSVVVIGADAVKRVVYANCSGQNLSMSISDHALFSNSTSVDANQLYDSAGGAGYSASDVSLELNQKTSLITTVFPPNTAEIAVAPYSLGVVELK